MIIEINFAAGTTQTIAIACSLVIVGALWIIARFYNTKD